MGDFVMIMLLFGFLLVVVAYAMNDIQSNPNLMLSREAKVVSRCLSPESKAYVFEVIDYGTEFERKMFSEGYISREGFCGFVVATSKGKKLLEEEMKKIKCAS